MPRTKPSESLLEESSVTTTIPESKPIEEFLDKRLEAINKFSRNNTNGLINSINYIFHEDGTINWRAMIKKEYLVPNKEKFPLDTDFKSLDIDSLDDSRLLILLGGLKDLAQLRGYTSVSYDVIEASQMYVAIKCNISWIGNYETNMLPITFSSLADCHMDNTKSFARDFLLAIAENRAFVRAVRNFLKINIVGQDELGDKKSNNHIQKSDPITIPASTNDNSLSPIKVLESTMKEANLTFELVKTQLIKEGDSLADSWNSISDIPNIKIFEIIERIKRKKKKS